MVQTLLKVLQSENSNMQKLHWSIIAILSIMCCECGCSWALRGKEIDSSGVLTNPQQQPIHITPPAKPPATVPPGNASPVVPPANPEGNPAIRIPLTVPSSSSVYSLTSPSVAFSR